MADPFEPKIDLSQAKKAVLTFWTWFEIENVNPNASEFDLMVVEVSSDGGETFEDVGRLNPYSDPVLLDRHHLPFKNGSFNIVANWIPVTVDLSDHRSDEVQIQFSFLTIDSLFNVLEDG